MQGILNMLLPRKTLVQIIIMFIFDGFDPIYEVHHGVPLPCGLKCLRRAGAT